MTKPFQRLNTHYGIHLYALLLLSDIEWEVAYSTLCTEKKKFCWKNCTSFTHGKARSWASSISNSHMLHTQTTQAHIDRVGEQWTIAAAKKITRRCRSLWFVSLFCFFSTITIIINRNCYGAPRAKEYIHTNITFLPNFHSLQYLVFLIAD